MVNELPADHPDRARYITLFREMAEKISAVQGECSIGRATKETVTRGWSAMVKAVHPDGMLGWVQRIGDQPGATTANTTEVYGVGALLLAGSEVYRLAT